MWPLFRPAHCPTTFRSSVKVTPNSPSQDYTHPDDHNLRTYDMTPGFKPFTMIPYCYGKQISIKAILAEDLLIYLLT